MRIRRKIRVSHQPVQVPTDKRQKSALRLFSFRRLIIGKRASPKNHSEFILRRRPLLFSQSDFPAITRALILKYLPKNKIKMSQFMRFATGNFCKKELLPAMAESRFWRAPTPILVRGKTN